MRSKDLDILIVVDKLNDVKEKHELEIEIARSLRHGGIHKSIDVVVFDVEVLKENAKPGGLISGLIAGYVPIYDDLGIPRIINNLLYEITGEDGYTIIKDGRKLNLSSLAKARKIANDY